MVRKFLNFLLQVNPLYLVLIYVLLQSFLYFHPFIHSARASFFFLAVDPELFARDIIRTTTLGTTTFFYKFMQILLGDNLANPYYLFWPYFVTCLFIAWAVFLIGKRISGGRNEVGILMLILLLVQKETINGAYVSLIFADFNYAHFTLPILFFALYFLFKEKYSFFTILLVTSFYFHLKTPAAITISLLPLLIFQISKKPKMVLSLLIPFILLIPKVMLTVNQLYGQGEFSSLDEKVEYMQMVIEREEIEGSMFFDTQGVTNLIVYSLFAIVGILTAQLIADKNLRSKVYFCHGGVFFTFGLGILIRIIDHFWGPLGEIVVLGYARASILGLILALATISLFFYQRIEVCKQANSLNLFFILALLYFIGINDFYFESFSDIISIIFSSKTLAKLVFAFTASLVTTGVVRLMNHNVATQTLLSVLLVLSLAYVSLKGVAMVYRSYKSHYPYFPFVPQASFFSFDLYEAGKWAKENTQKNDLFLVAFNEGKNEEDFCHGDFRNKSLRSCWCQDFLGTYGNPVAYREWKRRRNLLRNYLGTPLDQWDSLLSQENINYILSSKNLSWTKKSQAVFENNSYVIYRYQ